MNSFIQHALHNKDILHNFRIREQYRKVIEFNDEYLWFVQDEGLVDVLNTERTTTDRTNSVTTTFEQNIIPMVKKIIIDTIPAAL